jgi:uncharacterized protein (TIGR03000 family)
VFRSISLFARVAALAIAGALVMTPASEAQHRFRGGRGNFFGGPGFFGPGLFGPGLGYGGGLWGSPYRWGGGYPSSSAYSSTNIYQPISVFVSLNVTQQTFNGAADNAEAPAEMPASIEVTVPANATLWIDGKKTQQTGTVRIFSTPPLSPSGILTYDLRAIWTDESGAEVIRTQAVQVAPSQRVTVNLTDSLQ